MKDVVSSLGRRVDPGDWENNILRWVEAWVWMLHSWSARLRHRVGSGETGELQGVFYCLLASFLLCLVMHWRRGGPECGLQYQYQLCH
jgi:hypothetical protein